MICSLVILDDKSLWEKWRQRCFLSWNSRGDDNSTGTALWTIPLTFSLKDCVCCSVEAVESVMINELGTTAVTPVLFWDNRKIIPQVEDTRALVYGCQVYILSLQLFCKCIKLVHKTRKGHGGRLSYTTWFRVSSEMPWKVTSEGKPGWWDRCSPRRVKAVEWIYFNWRYGTSQPI